MTPPQHMTLLMVAALAGCATTVPNLRAEDLRKVEMSGLAPRSLALAVEEERQPRPEESVETVSRLRAALEGVLARSGIEVGADSPNRLRVRISSPETVPEGFSRETCVSLDARLDMQDGAHARSQADACHEWKHVLGFSLGSDATETFKSLVDYVLGQLDAQLRKLAGDRGTSAGRASAPKRTHVA